MKKLIRILIAYTIFCSVVCIALGFFTGDVPPLTSGMASKYKFLNGLKLCFSIFPAIIFTGITMGCALSFGRNPEGSKKRFSVAMFVRFRTVLIAGLVSVFVLTIVKEIGLLCVNVTQNKMAQMPEIIADYLRTGNELCERGEVKLARQYVDLVLKIEEENKESFALSEKIETVKTSSKVYVKEKPHRAGIMANYSDKDSATVDELYERAKEAEKKEEWFAAHYYAESALQIISDRDITKSALQRISVRAWNKLSAPFETPESEEEKIFKRKLEGYTALQNGDNLHAYYVFLSLSQTSRTLANDADISRYLQESERRLLQESFFMDEKSFSGTFEAASNIYFSLKKNPSDSNSDTQIIFIKGITNAPRTKNVVQYLRGFSLFNIDANGKFVSGFYVPFAKLLEISTENIPQAEKAKWNIPEDAKFIPEVLLRSVDRNSENIFEEPVYYNMTESDVQKNILFLPLAFSDYLLLADASHGAQYMDITSLFSFIPKAENFGYAKEIFSEALIARLLYPLFLLSLILFFAAYAWNNRIAETALFKFNWVFSFPLFTVLFYFANQVFAGLFRLQTFAILELCNAYALPVCIIFYVLVFVVASIVFLSRNDTTVGE